MLISVPFITATILVYMCVPEIRNIHAIILSCYLATLAVAYTTLASVQLINGVYNTRIEQPGCSIIAHVIYFAFLSTFFWTNVLSFDLWSGFRCVLCQHWQNMLTLFIFHLSNCLQEDEQWNKLCERWWRKMADCFYDVWMGYSSSFHSVGRFPGTKSNDTWRIPAKDWTWNMFYRW